MNEHGFLSLAGVSVGGQSVRLKGTVFCLALLLCQPEAQEAHNRYSPDDITVTRWVDPTGSKPLTAADWMREHPRTPIEMTPVWSGRGQRGTVLFLIRDYLWESLGTAMMEYIEQLESEGWSVTATVVQGGGPESLKEVISNQCPAGEGVFAVGNLPVAWFQIHSDWGYEEFPCDLYYMDLDGEWEDLFYHDVIAGRDTLLPGADGIFDTHRGRVAPDVWLGRLEASTISWGDEEWLLQNYMEKNLAYRRGGLRLPQRALSYVDDDWSDCTTVGLDSIYEHVTVSNDPEETRASDYEERLLDGYEWIHVMVHSWPGGHSFKYNNGQSWDTFYAWDLFHTMDAEVHFLNLFACSNARYTDANYMAGVYVMAGSTGLGAIGSTKTGSMLFFEEFYEVLGNGGTLGEAYLDWFQKMAEDGFEPWQRDWFYGMTIIGDPTLRITLDLDDEPPTLITDLSISVDQDSLCLQWSPATDNVWIDHYVVYRFEEAFQLVGAHDSLATVLEVSFWDRLPGESTFPVYYLVRARDGAGNLADDSNRVGVTNYDLGIRVPTPNVSPRNRSDHSRAGSVP